METRKLVALGVALVASGAGVLAGQESAGCEPVGDIRFICDLIGPEDLAIVPGDEWVVVSGNQEGGRIHLINVADKTTSVLFPTADRVERLDAWTRDQGSRMAELAITWLLEKDYVCTVLVAVTSIEQLEANVAATEWMLSRDQVQEVEAIVAGSGGL